MENISLQLKRYIVNHIYFELNDSFNAAESKELRILPNFQRAVTKLNANDAIIKLSVKIDNSDKSLPFALNVTVSGLFSMENWFDEPQRRQIMEQSSVTILYPYLRALVNTLTANANIPPYSLPLLNIADLFNKAAAQQAPQQPQVLKS